MNKCFREKEWMCKDLKAIEAEGGRQGLSWESREVR